MLDYIMTLTVPRPFWFYPTRLAQYVIDWEDWVSKLPEYQKFLDLGEAFLRGEEVPLPPEFFDALCRRVQFDYYEIF